MYEIVIEQKARKSLRKLPDEIRQKIVRVISGLASNPRCRKCKKLKNSKYYRVRVSDYRIIYAIEDRRFILLIIDIGHRKDIYRNL